MLHRLWIIALVLFGTLFAHASTPNTNDINITVAEINASCGEISSNVDFQYYNWFSFCPAGSRPEALSFLYAHNFATEQLPTTCQMPADPEHQPGIHYSDEIPEGYELVENNLTSVETIYYHAYPKSYYEYTFSGGSAIEYFNILTNGVYTGGVRANASIWNEAIKELN